MTYLLKFLRFLWHLLPFSLRVRLGEMFWNFYKFIYLYLMPKPERLVFNRSAKYHIVGFLSANLSHKMVADLMFMELDKQGLSYNKIDISDAYYNHKSGLILDTENPPQAGDNIIFIVNPDIMPFIMPKFPKNYFKNSYLIGYWVYELEKLPLIWRSAINKVNEIWVPSNFVKTTIEQYASAPIRVVPHAVGLLDYDTNRFTRESILKEIGIDDDVFIALCSFSFSSSMERKNIIGTINAFEKAFAGHNDRILILRYINETRFDASFKKLKYAVNAANCRIMLINGDELGGGILALFKLYKAADVLLSLHRSEGFGLQIFEALRFNLPVIATNYSGNVDFMDDKITMPVSYELVNVQDSDGIYNLHNAKWAEPNINDAATILVKFANDKNLQKNFKKQISASVGSLLKGTDF